MWYPRFANVRLALIGACLAWLPLQTAWPQPDTEKSDRTESPYFFVHSDDPNVDRLPLKATQVDVRVTGVIADVTVTQQYKNEGTRPIETRYVSPAPRAPRCTA